MTDRIYAPIVTRRGSSFPFRNGRYFDCSKLGGGIVRLTSAPGAVRLTGKRLLDLRTGEVYDDLRFAEDEQTQADASA